MKYLTFMRVVDTGIEPQEKYLPIAVPPGSIAYVTPTNQGNRTILGLIEGTKYLLADDYEDVRATLTVFHT